MKSHRLILPGLIVLAVTVAAMPPTRDRSVRPALSADAEVAAAATIRLRAEGPSGLEKLLLYRNSLISSGEAVNEAEMARLNAAIDAVGGAKYCSASGLYWHTDFEQAKAAAEKEGKPILSLRMLGNLTDDLSCANSRFFRTTLYANAEISALLRENFVLHWKSVRPVPKITIDFGDGRKVERTITGNSAHYVLLHDGTIVDCLPGLYGPQAFREKLVALASVAKLARDMNEKERQLYLVGFHQDEEDKIVRAWQADLVKLGLATGQRENLARSQVRFEQAATAAAEPRKAAAPTKAEEAARIAMPKAKLELPAIRAIVGRLPELEKTTTEAVWEQIAQLHAAESQLDDASRTLIASQNPTAAAAGQLAITKQITESPLVRMLRSLEESVAMDTVRNEYELHRKLHRWFVDGTAPANVDELNERVYAELFLTPRSDPWLGLVPADAYAALPNNGVVRQNDQ